MLLPCCSSKRETCSTRQLTGYPLGQRVCVCVCVCVFSFLFSSWHLFQKSATGLLQRLPPAAMFSHVPCPSRPKAAFTCLVFGVTKCPQKGLLETNGSSNKPTEGLRTFLRIFERLEQTRKPMHMTDSRGTSCQGQ